MGTTISLVAIYIGLLLMSLMLQAMFLRWGLKWSKVANITLKRALLVACVFALVSAIISLGFLALESESPPSQIIAAVAQLVLQILVPCLILARVFATGLRQAVLSWLPTIVPAVAVVAFLFLVFRPYVYEAFVAPTNSMAPTLLGDHLTGRCPRCGKPAYGAVPAPGNSMPADGQLMICQSDLKTCHPNNVGKEVAPPDRFLVNKMISPRRWDVIAFRLPSNPDVYYVKRLVGLPGEELLIRDGAVWINGEKLDPPETLRGIEYLAELDWGGMKHPGAGSITVKLADDEYFVLGDFSAQASDSRFWETGAPGHPSYAVPQSHIVGVVTHIFWPLNRWRVLR